MKIIHEMTLDVSRQGVQASIPLTQHDAGIHSLRIHLRNGAKELKLNKNIRATLWVAPDTYETVVVYTDNGAYPNTLECELSPYVTNQVGEFTAQLQLFEEGTRVFNAPEFVMLIREDKTSGTEVLNSPKYKAVVDAASAAEAAADEAVKAANKLKSIEAGEGENSLQQIGNQAIGDYSFARGSDSADTEIGGTQTTGNIARGKGSTAEGAGTETGEDGIGAHAEGSIGKITAEDDSPYRPTTANQRGAHAEGCGVLVDGKGAHGEGYATEVYSEGGHVEGKRVKVTEKAVAGHGEGAGGEVNGYASHKEGINGIANGKHSHVEGADGEANGNNSHVEGWGCKTGDNAGASHAGGEGSQTDHYGAFAHGAWLKTSRRYQVVFGTANADNDKAYFMVGNGTLDDNDEPETRSNIFEIVDDHGEIAIVLGGEAFTVAELLEATGRAIYHFRFIDRYGDTLHFECEGGMTWRDFIESDYNDYFYTSRDDVLDASGHYIRDDDFNGITDMDEIVNGATYYCNR